MASQNVRIHVKTEAGYNDLMPETLAKITKFNNSGSNLASTNAEDAIKEVNTKIQQTDSNVSNANTRITATEQKIEEVNTTVSKVDTISKENKTAIGALSSLATTAKNNLVSAINELRTQLYDLFVKKTDVVDNLTTTSKTAPLSANMGNTLNDRINSVNNDVATIGQWQTYEENNWTLRYRKTGHKRYQIHLNNTSPNGFNNVKDNLIMARTPLKYDSTQRLVVLLHVSQSIVGYGNAQFRDDGSITVSTTNYSNAVTCECYGEVIVK